MAASERTSHSLPQDIIRLICQQVLLSADPSQLGLLIDPYIRIKDDPNGSRTITLELSPIVQAHQTLKSLCLVSRQWNLEARKFLWASGIQFGLPRSFETVVKTVDPIASFFDGGIEPTWLMSPPASRLSSPVRQICAADQPISVSSIRRIPSNLESYRRPGRRSVSLKRQGGNYILQPHSETDYPCLDPHDSAIDDDRGRQRAFERSISPIRSRVAVQTLSQAFRRTSVSSSHSRTRSSPLLEENPKNFDLPGHCERLRESDEEDEQDEDEYIFDHRIDDIFNPAPYITSISFSKYRSHGMRRSVAEGHQFRFVTSERLMRLIRSTRSRYSGLYDNKDQENLAGLNPDSESHLLLRKGKLEAVGFSEYMDSALTKSVLDEILLRGGVEVEYQVIDPSPCSMQLESSLEGNDGRGRTRSRKEIHTASHLASPHHTLPAPVGDVAHDYLSASPTLTSSPMSFDVRSPCPFKIERRLESSLLMETPVKALDLCGCISSKVRIAIKEFIEDHALSSSGPPPSRGDPQTITGLIKTPSGLLRSTQFPYLTRLGLSRVIILDDLELADFLSGFPNLLDLDLSYTRAGSNVLHTLQRLKKHDRNDNGIKTCRQSFRSLNLGKCKGLTKDCLVGFLCGLSQSTGNDTNSLERWEDPNESIGELEELSLFGDFTQPTPLDSEAMNVILDTCPALLSGKLTTLDLSSVMIDDREFDFKRKIAPQPRLLQFGIGFCPNISLETIQYLLKEKMKSVEVLDLSSSCSAARQRRTTFGQPSSAMLVTKLHTDLITPVSRVNADGSRTTSLRVIELDDASLQAIRGGADGWKVAFGKGQRGWYVDLSARVIITRSHWPDQPSSRQVIHESIAGKDLMAQLECSQLELLSRNETVGLEVSLRALKNVDETIRHTEIGWMSRKTEILHNSGLLGRQDGLYGFHAFAC